MLTLPPVFTLLTTIKMTFGLATPVLMGLAGTRLWSARPFFGFCFLLAAALIFVGFAAPMLLSDGRLAPLQNVISLACSAGWFMAGLALIMLGFEHRTKHSERF